MARKKKCKSRDCGKWFYTLPDLPDASVCSPDCGLLYGRELRLKADDKAHRARKLVLRSKSDWLKLCQKEFNAFIRLRDMNEPCISCGRWHQGQWHASHYRAVGGLGSPLRFNELNCHRACSVCNNHKSGNLLEYRIALIKKIGLPLVEWLEKDYPSQNWKTEDIKWLTKYYKEAQKQFLLDPVESTPF